jgi:apolipoprotein N-acyltransferase
MMPAGPVPRWVLFGLVLLAGLLLPLALPNELFRTGNPALGPFCIAPVFIAASLAPTFGAAALLGVVFGAVSTALSSFWLMFFQDFSIWTYGGTILGYAGYNALLFAFLRGFGKVARRYRPFIFAMAWALYEYFKSVGFLAYPWGLIAYPVSDWLPLVQFIDTTGIWGLSFLAALANSLVAEWAMYAWNAAPPLAAVSRLGPSRLAWRSMLARDAAFTGIVLAVILGYGFLRLAQPEPAGRTATFLLVQQNIDPWDSGKARAGPTRINQDLTLQGLAEAGRPIDLVAWSETSVMDAYVRLGDGFDRKSSMVPFAQEAGVPILFGGVVIVDARRNLFMNGAILISPEGEILDTYGKMHPVPFAESIPFFTFPPVQWFFTRVVGVWFPWVQGTRFTIFRVPLSEGGELAFGAPICFEDAFSDLCRRFILNGAGLWVNLTNDYWSKTVSSEYQHFQVARFRAVENRRVLVRSTNGGVTAVVDPKGRITAMLPTFERTSLTISVPVADRALTPYTVLGDWFPWTLAGVLLLLLVVDLAATRRLGEELGRIRPLPVAAPAP